MSRRQVMRHPSLVIGLFVALVFALLGLVSLWWTPFPIEQIAIARRFAGPSATHWLGTDHLGRDLLSLVMSGTLTSFMVAVLAVGIGIGIGVPMGLAAAAWGGMGEWVGLRFSGLTFAFPSGIVAILITTAFSIFRCLRAWRAAGRWPLPRLTMWRRRGWPDWVMPPSPCGLCCPTS